MDRLGAANREMTFIFHDINDIIELVGNQVTKIDHSFGDKSMHVAMYIGVDATIIVRGWQILISHNNIIGGASPNHFLDISDKLKEEMVEFLICLNVNKGGVASEVKVPVL